MTMKHLFAVLFLVPGFLFANPKLAGKYHIELYFEAKPFQDILTLEVDGAGNISGLMHVPNDFDAPIEGFVLEGTKFSFDYIVPKNKSRPVDFRARYYGEFYDSNFQRLAGLAKNFDANEYMASFIGYKIP
jgi:hypothetical protein